ncbi:hypothetical protein DH2020_032575 [Rehmannia glutinosa]|uniref:RING-CH-type domain-containing protein n=1 Tax=Rehmannia glutinosa TaxID=99300 RepID=A0ABR0VH14_REHGL
MGEHLVVNVDQLPKPEAVGPSQPVPQAVGCGPTGKKPELVGSSSSTAPVDDKEEDSVNNLESPCACSGSLKYAHRKCVQHWCNEKGDITSISARLYCSSRPPPDETTIDIGGVWQISGTPLDIHDPRLLALAEAERQLFEADYDDYNGANSSGTAFCRSAALILMALLLLRHALSITGDGDGGDGEGDEDASTFFSLFLLRAVGFLLPCYIMIWAINILQRRRQRQEAAALAAARLAIVVQAAQSRGLLVASTAPAVASQST